LQRLFPDVVCHKNKPNVPGWRDQRQNGGSFWQGKVGHFPKQARGGLVTIRRLDSNPLIQFIFNARRAVFRRTRLDSG